MTKLLEATQFGNPILREVAKRLTTDEILSDEVQALIADMYYTLQEREQGVGLAAPQVGESVALSVIGIKPTPTRPNLEIFNTVLINPEVVETYGRAQQMWEGCVSSGELENTLYAQVPRYKKIRLTWLDENAIAHDEVLEGFVAHVAQHETDHLNGVLFVDRVKDTKTYMLASEYKKHIANK